MIRIKPGVSFRKITPQMVLAVTIADQLNEGRDTWITSNSDDAPGRVPNSLHRVGNAIDLGVKNVPDPKAWADAIRTRLDREFDVVLHGVGPNLHVHLEYQPK